MSKFTVYLAGTIDSLAPEKACSWRSKAIAYFYSCGIHNYLDPYRHFLSGKYKFPLNNFQDIRTIIQQDLQDIQNSDCVLCYFPERLSVGACMEIFYAANSCGIPVIVVIKDKEIQDSMWMKYWATKIVSDIETGMCEVINEHIIWKRAHNQKGAQICNEEQ